MTKKMIMLSAMIACTSAMVACSDDDSTKADSGYCHCYSKSPYINTSDMNSTAAAIHSEDGCKQYDYGSAGYFACEWISY